MSNIASEATLTPISAPYLLAIGITCYIDSNGSRYFDELWVKDLIEHLRYIKKLTVLGPVIYATPPAAYVNLGSVDALKDIKYIDLPGGLGLVGSLFALPRIIKISWNAVRDNTIIHTAIAGWPIPYGWILSPMAKIRKKYLVVIVESSFWRLTPGIPASLKARVRAGFSEFLGRWCVNHADLALFTQEEYKKSLLTSTGKTGFVDPASWIDEDKVVSLDLAQSLWDKKSGLNSTPVKVLFVGRLNSKKGIDVVLQAVNILESRKCSINLDILGDGELLGACKKVSQEERTSVKLKTLGTVPYDASFYELLRQYHFLIVPTISDEQPRVIYDAFSQALPVLASDTAGNRSCIKPGLNGKLFKPNDAAALSDAIAWSSANISELRYMGLNAAKEASSMTHSAMHKRRWALLAKCVEGA